MEYIRGIGAPGCIFHNKHKTLYNTFSPDPADSCVCDKLVSHCKIYTLCCILLIFLGVRHWCVHMGQVDFISSILFDFFFSKLSGNYTLQMYSLINPLCLWILPWFANSGNTQISVYIHVPFDQAVVWDKQCNFCQASMYTCSLVSAAVANFLWNY